MGAPVLFAGDRLVISRALAESWLSIAHGHELVLEVTAAHPMRHGKTLEVRRVQFSCDRCGATDPWAACRPAEGL